MTTWKQLEAKLRGQLQDTDVSNATWSPDELRGYANAALDELSGHTARQRVHSLTVEVSTLVLEMPADLLALGPVSVAVPGTLEKQLMVPIERRPGGTYPPDSSLSVRENSYYEWPVGVLNFMRSLQAGTAVSAGYYAYWPEIQTDSDVLGIPRWMEGAIYWYVLASAMYKPGIQAAQIRQYNTRRDSGSPIDNPLLEFSKYAMRRHAEILASHPHQDRSSWEASE
jgi:hypothetical protein